MPFSSAFAQAADGASQQGSFVFNIVFLVAIFVLFYFILIRPQQKRQKAHDNMVKNLEKGDEVISNGGILGRVTQVGEQYISLRVADGVELRMQKTSVHAVLPKGSLKAAAPEKD